MSNVKRGVYQFVDGVEFVVEERPLRPGEFQIVHRKAAYPVPHLSRFVTDERGRLVLSLEMPLVGYDDMAPGLAQVWSADVDPFDAIMRTVGVELRSEPRPGRPDKRNHVLRTERDATALSALLGAVDGMHLCEPGLCERCDALRAARELVGR